MLTLVLALLQAPVACIDPAAPLAELVRSQPLPATLDPRADRLVADAIESGRRQDIWTALRRLEQVHRRKHDDPAVHLAFGLLYSITPDFVSEGSEGYRHRRVHDNTNADGYVGRYLVRAAELDPGLWLAGVTLARVAVGLRDADRFADAERVLRAQLARDSSNAAVRVALADVLVARGHAADAAAVLRPLAGSGCAGAGAAIAETRMLLGDSAGGARAYLDALANASPDAVHRFYDDVRVVLSPAERRAYAALPEAARRQWLLDYWDRSAAASGRDVAERIVEHVRRLAHAHREYRLARSEDRGGRPADNMRIEQAIYDNDLPWDARGITYIRHGAPDRVIETKEGALLFIPINETWVYFGEDPPRMVHFVQDRLGGWALAKTTFVARCGTVNPGPPAIGRRLQSVGNRGGSPTDVARAGSFAADYYGARALYDPRYAVLAGGCHNLASADMMKLIVTDMDHDYRRAVSSLLATESANRRFPLPLRLSLAGYQFRDRAGRPEVAAIAWLNLADAAAERGLGALRVRFALVDSAGAPLRFDTTLAVPAHAAASGAVLRIATAWSNVALRAPRLRVFAEDQADPQRGGDLGVHLPAAPNAERVSDIVIGESERPGPLVRGSTRLAPLPSHTLRVGEAYRLYFEVYGLDEGEPLETTIRVRRTDDDGLRELLRFFRGKAAERELRLAEPAAPDARGITVRDVSVAGDLVPGEYHVEVLVKGRFGTATRTTRLRVIALPIE